MRELAPELNGLTARVVDSAMKVHTLLGPGLLESAYQACLAHELRVRGLGVRTEVPLAVRYGDVRLDVGYRIDLLVEESVVVELKAVAKLLPIHEAQLLSYLRLGRWRVGLLLNFSTLHLRDGIRRLVNERGRRADACGGSSRWIASARRLRAGTGSSP